MCDSYGLSSGAAVVRGGLGGLFARSRQRPRAGVGSRRLGDERRNGGLDRQAGRDGQPEMGHHAQREEPLFHQAVLQLHPRAGGVEGRREERHGHRARNRSRAAVAGVGAQEERGRIVLPHSQACPEKGPRSFRRQAEAGGQDRLVDEPARGSSICNGSSSPSPAARVGGRRRSRRRPAPMSRPRSSRKPLPKGEIKSCTFSSSADLPGHGAAGDGLHPGPVRRLQTRLRLRQDRRLQPQGKSLAGNADRHRRRCP